MNLANFKTNVLQQRWLIQENLMLMFQRCSYKSLADSVLYAWGSTAAHMHGQLILRPTKIKC